jgi:hypothetical protein
VLAQALTIVAQADTAAAVVWASASSYAPYAPLAREQEIWAAILAPIGDKAEKAAAAAWSGQDTGSGIEVPRPDLPHISASPPKIDSERLKGYLAAAAGPASQPPKGVSTNNHAVQASYGYAATEAWADFFGVTASTGIALTVNAVLQATAESIDVTPLAVALGEYSTTLSRAIAIALAPLNAIELRSRVLLWRAALYSKSQRKAYRELAPQLAVIAIAADLATEVPPISPASIDHLVWEAAYTVFGDERTTIGGFARGLNGVDTKLLGSKAVEPGRKTLLEFFRGVAASGEVPPDVRGKTGVEADTEIRLADLARWLFRDLRAERIVTVPTRSRGRRK